MHGRDPRLGAGRGLRPAPSTPATGSRSLGHDAEAGELRGRIAVRDELLTEHGLVHGGVFAGAAEAIASTGTALAVMGDGNAAMGLSNDTTVLADVREGTIHFLARAVHRGEREWVWTVDATGDDDAPGRALARDRRRAPAAEARHDATAPPSIGAGPAGFYTTDQLLEKGWEVDLYDALPTPFGLVRSGVAPDHPKLKSVTRIYEKTAAKPGFRFFGGVELGRDVTREELLERYHAVVYAVGTGDDNRLGIPGEDRPGSHSATEFVAWYNGHPDYPGHQFDLSGGRAVVIGNGNVAIDVARMLVLDPSELAPTDTADHAIEHFGRSTVDEVILLGRRGPAQAAFTNPEVRELGELARADVVCDPAQVEEATERRDADRSSATSRCSATTRRASRRASRTGSSCASCAPRSRSSARARTAPSPACASRSTGSRTAAPCPRARRRSSSAGSCCARSATAGGPLDGIPWNERARPDRQRGRPRRARRVLRRLDQARPLRRDRHQQEGRRRHRRADPRGRGRPARSAPRRRPTPTRSPPGSPSACRTRHLGGLAGDRRGRDAPPASPRAARG